MYIFCSKALADALNIKKNELQKMPADAQMDDLYAWHETIHGHRIENAKNDLCRKNNIRLIRILEAGCRTYDNCMCLQCDDESLESYDWALISLFNALGIAMNVDCERDMREMFLWYQKYQMSGKKLICKKMFGTIMPNG